MNSWFSRAVTATAVAGITLLGSAPASAASNWSASAPKYATSVGTVKSATVTISKKKYTLQLRTGKWGGKSYIWGRVPKSANADGNILVLEVYNKSKGKWEDSPIVRIKNTTYTQGYRTLAGYQYRTCTKHSNLGGSRSCISWTV